MTDDSLNGFFGLPIVYSLLSIVRFFYIYHLTWLKFLIRNLLPGREKTHIKKALISSRTGLPWAVAFRKASSWARKPSRTN